MKKTKQKNKEKYTKSYADWEILKQVSVINRTSKFLKSEWIWKS